VLDLGTNNCRLLIAHPAGTGFRVINSFSRIVRLGEGVAATGLLSEAAIDRTVAALKICAQRIAKYRAARVYAVATQAARLARNSAILVARAKKEAGLELAIISAEEEAHLAALGCTPLVGRRHQGALIFDIGGGSTEIIHVRRRGEGFETLLSASLPVGVVTLAETAGGENFAAMRAAMREKFKPFARGFTPAKEHLLGTSGTVTTLAAIAMKLPRYNRARVDASWHQTKALMAVVEGLAGLDAGALAEIGPIGPERADLMLAGSAIFSAICELWPSPMMRVADRGLREGMLRQLSQEMSS
jgi:exopolyphosphatase/guanosine-5'-triphosphate,3'-diphosphate pyrophosphatase